MQRYRETVLSAALRYPHGLFGVLNVIRPFWK